MSEVNDIIQMNTTCSGVSTLPNLMMLQHLDSDRGAGERLAPVATTQAESGDVIDLAVAYALGEISDSDSKEFSESWTKGDTRLTQTYDSALETIAELPGILSPTLPPGFAKERVMKRVHEEHIEEIYSE